SVFIVLLTGTREAAVGPAQSHCGGPVGRLARGTTSREAQMSSGPAGAGAGAEGGGARPERAGKRHGQDEDPVQPPTGVERGAADPSATEDEQAEQQEQLEEGLDEIESAREEIEEGREELVEARAQAEFFGMLDEAGDEIDANMAELEENAELVEEQKAELDAGMSLLETSSEIHTVSDDGSTALVNVSFSDPPEGISTETRQDLMSTFTDNPVDGVTVDFSTDIVNDISGV